MGQILNLANLRDYASARYRNDLPDWALPDMLHLKIPVLAYRDYANDYTDRDFPLCWQRKRHIVAALRLTVTILMALQATRRKGGARRILRRLEPKFPGIVSRLQKGLRPHVAQWLKSSSVEPDSKAHRAILTCMAKAVDEIAEIVRIPTQKSSKAPKRKPTTNPMLGSKILSFFFPEFFPIWDTAWVSKALAGPLKASRGDGAALLPSALSSHGAAVKYARYVNVMITDAWDTSDTQYNQLCAESFRLCARAGYDDAKQVLDQFQNDFLPTLFEACLLGRAARRGEL
jgi:hypothetical protein